MTGFDRAIEKECVTYLMWSRLGNWRAFESIPNRQLDWDLLAIFVSHQCDRHVASISTDQQLGTRPDNIIKIKLASQVVDSEVCHGLNTFTVLFEVSGWCVILLLSSTCATNTVLFEIERKSARDDRGSYASGC